MPEPRFHRLQIRLRRGGVAPRYIRRTIEELQDHYEDAEAAALERGLPAAEAAAAARRAIGSERSIAAAVLAQPSLKSWPHRWPRAAGALRAGALAAALPAAPLVYCAQRGETLARWALSASLAALITAGLLFALQSALAPAL